MGQIIDPLAKIRGVSCVVLFDPLTNIAEQHASIPYEEIVLRDILMRIGSVHDNCVSLAINGNPKMFQAFEQGFVAIRKSNGYTLITVATRETNMAMLGIAMNVAAKRLSSIKTKAAVPSPPPIPVPQPAEIEPTLRPMKAEVEGTNVSSSRSSSRNVNTSVSSSRNSSRSVNMSMSWTVEPERISRRFLTEDAIGIKVMQHLLVRLARLIGKHDATFFLEDELMKIGETPATIRHEQFGELIKCVAKRISDSDKRETFVMQALGDTPTS